MSNIKQDNVTNRLRIYTDGACSGNPGPGGWGAVLLWKKHTRELSGGDPLTTNNRMELTAAIKALEVVKRRENVTLFTDSKYLMDGITLWIDGWKKLNWKRKGSGKVKNIDLWQELDRLNQYHHITWTWVKGHSGEKWNDRADELARNAIPRSEETCDK